jgi:nucleoid-associated protein YgaU
METAKLLTIDLVYNLFKPSGQPLRAKATCTFAISISDEVRLKLEDQHSPDLTHVRTVKDGDTLPMMCHEMYGDPKYYLEVARVNKLKNFRSLSVGEKIFFPPLDKTSL